MKIYNHHRSFLGDISLLIGTGTLLFNVFPEFRHPFTIILFNKQRLNWFNSTFLPLYYRDRDPIWLLGTPLFYRSPKMRHPIIFILVYPHADKTAPSGIRAQLVYFWMTSLNWSFFAYLWESVRSKVRSWPHKSDFQVQVKMERQRMTKECICKNENKADSFL